MSNQLSDIVKKFSADVLTQKIYKAKVIFLGVDRKDPGYSKYKKIDVNCRPYLITDGEINYIPEEVKSALQDAVSYSSQPRNKKQEKDGMDYDDPTDRYEKIPDPRFDVTVLETFHIVINENGERELKSDSAVTQLEIENTREFAVEERIKEAVNETKELDKLEFKEKFEKLKALIPEGVSEEEIRAIIEG